MTRGKSVASLLMIQVGLICLFVLFLAPAQAHAAASFNCAKAARPVEKLICADPRLGDADGRLAAVYAKALEYAADSSAQMQMRDAQRVWLAGRDRLCQTGGDADRARACLRDAYARRIAEIDSGRTIPVAAAPNYTKTPVAVAVLDRAYAGVKDGYAAFAGQFSPDGSALALAVNWTSGGYPAQQLWLYDPRRATMTPVIETPKADAENVKIEAFAFAPDGTLFVAGYRIVIKDQSRNSHFKLAVAGGVARPIAAFPASVAPELARQAAGDAPGFPRLSQRTDRYVVSVSSRGNLGHEFDLVQHPVGGGRGATIASGGDGLTRFFLDGAHYRVIFAGGGSLMEPPASGIVIYDLATTARTVVAGDSAAVLAVSADGGDILASFVEWSGDKARGRVYLVHLK